MKIPLLLLFSAAFACGGDFRKWTETSTKRTIEGTITDKKFDGSSARVITTEDKTVWIETAKLLPADQEFIKKWIAPSGRLQAKVIASGKKPGYPGWKRIKVTYSSGASPMVIKWIGDKRRAVKAGESGEFTFTIGDDYWVAAYVDGKEVDRETDKLKTGL